MQVDAKPKRLENSHGTRARRCGILAVCVALLLTVGVITLAVFTDRASHSMQFTTASFNADAYSLTRTAPVGPFCAGESVTATLEEGNSGNDAVCSVIAMKATWNSPDTALSIFGNADAADNAKLTVGGTDVDYAVSADKKSITFNLPEHVLAAGAANKSRDLTLTIPESFKSTGSVSFTFEKVVVGQEGGGFSETYDRTTADPDIKALDYSAKVGWAASSITAQNGKALMGYLTGKNAAGKYGIEFELAFGYTSSPMKDFAGRTDAKWSYYKGAVDTLAFVEGMTSIGDYAFPDFSGVKSVSFPATVRTIGVSAFDASGLTGTVTIPATVKEIRSLAFGNLPNVKTFTFGHGSGDTLTLPDNTAAGKRNTGAFYVSSHVDTTVNSDVEAIQYGYKWHDGYDNRRLVPTLNAQDTWFRTYASGDNYTNSSSYTAKLDKEKLQTVTFADYHMPVVGETSWDASDPSVPGTVTAYLSADKTSLILAGNGYGLVFANKDSSGAFNNLPALKTVSNTDLLDTRNATTMADMFNFDESLANISVSTWNVSKVTDMSNMFYFCDSLPSIDLKKNTCTAKDGSGQYTAWNTASLKNTGGMFMDYSGTKHALTTVDCTGWDTSKLETADYMFMECRGLTTVKGIEGWDVSSLKAANNMFQDCQGLQTINVANWNTASLVNTTAMFSNCTALKSIDISKWDMSKATTNSAMFSYCENLTKLTLPKSLTTISAGFAQECTRLTTIEFLHDADTAITFPAAGSDSGAFYVSRNLPTDIVGANTNARAYSWAKENRCHILKVPAQSGTLTYNQKAQTPVWDSNYVPDKMTIGKTTSGTNAGTYTASFTPKFGSCWADLTAGTKDVTWKIGKAPGSLSLSKTEAEIGYFDTSASFTVTRAGDGEISATSSDPSVATVDVSGNTVTVTKINKVSVSKKWLLNGSVDTTKKFSYTVGFTSNGKTYDSISAGGKAAPGASGMSYALYYGTEEIMRSENGGMFPPSAEAYREITFDKAPDGDLLTWLQANAVPQKDDAVGSSPSSSESVVITVKVGEGTNHKAVSEGKTCTVNVLYPGIVLLPAQSGTLIYNGKAQTPAWDSNYVSGRMTVGGTTSGTDAGTYTATFTPKNGYTWADGTTEAKNVTWKIGRAPGSLSLSKTTAEIGADETTTTFTVTRAGNGTIIATSNDTSVATVSVSGTTVTVTKKAAGTATITVSVRASANYEKPADATCEITCKMKPVLAANNTWYKSAQDKAAITKISLKDTYTPSGSEEEAWDASAAQDKSVMAYRTGTEIVIAGNGSGKIYANADSRVTFDKFAALTSIGGTTFLDTSEATDMSGMFQNCSKLAELNLSDWDTSNVTDMGWMFNNCSALTSLDLSGWKTNKVTEMRSMFADCGKLTNLDVSGFDTSSVTAMHTMFSHCSALASLNVSGWNTAKVTDITGMFQECSNLTELDLSDWNTSKVTDMYNTFAQCGALVSVGNLTDWDTSNVTNMSTMFNRCSALTSLDLSGWKTSNVTNMRSMFGKCSALTSVGDLSGWDTSNVTDMGYMFNACSSLTELNVTGWDTLKVADMSYMFAACEKLTSLNLSSFDTSAVTNMRNLFGGFVIKSGEFTEDLNVDKIQYPCLKLERITLGAKFAFVGAECYLPTPSSTYITGADGKWYDTRDASDYTPAALAGVTRTEARTYVALPPLAVPVQNGTLTYTGSALTPSWSGYDSSKMTVSGNSGVNAGTYTATFTLKDGQWWEDGTTAPKTATWKIGKAPGSLSLSKTEETFLTAVYLGGTNKLTTSFTVDRAGDGEISVTSSDTSVANVSVSGTTVTVTKTDKAGARFTATITVKVAEGTNHLAPKDATYTVHFVIKPVLESDGNWYRSSQDKDSITKISFVDSYTPTGAEDESWDAAYWTTYSGSITAYRIGTEVVVAGNSCGKIYLPATCNSIFADFSGLTELSGLDVLDTAECVNLRSTFYGCEALTSLDLSGWDMSKVKDTYYMFYNCYRLQSITLGAKFKFVSYKGYLPVPSTSYIPGADGKWYDTKTGTGYSPGALAGVTRTEPRTYTATKPTITTQSKAMSIMSSGSEISGYSVSE